MMHRGHWMWLAAIALGACSKAEPGAGAKQDLPIKAAKEAAAPRQEQIAYSYSFGFKLPRGRIAEVQAKHVALCDQLGPRCHIVSMEQAGDTRNAGGAIDLAVEAAAARRFGDALVDAAEHGGGDVTARTIQGENLTKQIVDVEARLRGRQALADRLLVIVKTHQGSIADLVTAEKALADVQQEIDTARAELAEAQGRVAMSNVHVGYAASASIGGFTSPVADAFGSIGSIAGLSLAALISLLAGALPWILPIGLVVLGIRWWQRRKRLEDE